MKTLLVSICLTVKLGIAQIPQTYQGTIYSGFSLFLPQNGPAWAVTKNPGLLGQNKNGMAGLLSERRFGMNELAQHQFLLILPLKNASLSTSISRFGSTTFSASSLSLGYGRKLNKIHIGIGFDFQTDKSLGYEGNSRVGAVAGISWQVNNRILTGLKIANPGFNDATEKKSIILPFEINWFINLLVSDQAGIGLTVDKQAMQPITLTFSFLYQPIEKITCRAGLLTTGVSPWVSFTYTLKKFIVEVFSTYHTQLGVSPGMSIVYQFKTGNQ